MSVLLLALVSLGGAMKNNSPCADFCKFTFCLPDGQDTRTTKSPRLLLRDPNVATHPFVCTVDSNDRFGRIKRVGEAMVAVANSRPRNFVPISNFKLGQVSRRFKKNYFKLREISVPPLPGKLGISRGRSLGDQADFVDDVCVYFPLLKYQIFLNGVRKNVKRAELEDCVAFRAVLGVLIIEFTWNAGDDFDLTVTEPNGNVISRSRPRSSTGGRLIRDNNVGTCGIAPVGREQVTYRTRATPLAGTYTVQARHFRSCGPVVDYGLTVIANGKSKLTNSGSTDVGSDELVLTETFTYP